MMCTAFSASDAVNTEPHPDAVHSWYDIPKQGEKRNEQCNNANSDTVRFFNQIK